MLLVVYNNIKVDFMSVFQMIQCKCHYTFGLNIIQVNVSHSALIGVQKPGWPERQYRCAPPARVVGHRLRQEDALREGRGGAIVRRGPGAPRGFQIPSCDGRPLAPFQIGTISLNPLIPPHTHLLLLLSAAINTRLKLWSAAPEVH